MRIVCPICSAAYDVHDRLLAPGRSARCARCGEEWVPMAAGLPPESEPEPEPEPAAFESAPTLDPMPAPRLSAMDRLASHPVSLPRRDLSLLLAWLVSLLVLLAVVIALVVWRGPIMHAWPPSTRLYHAIGVEQAP